MKLKLSFKVHFYSCFRYYLGYLVLVVLSLILKFTLNIIDSTYLAYIILSGLLFSIILGVYEYLIVLHTYLNFQSNPRAFWVSSIFANIINGIICLFITFIFNVILYISSNTPIIFGNLAELLILYIFAYSLGEVGYIILHRVKYLPVIIIIVLAIALIFFGSLIHNGLLKLISFYLESKLLCLIPLALAIGLNFLILFRLKRFIK